MLHTDSHTYRHTDPPTSLLKIDFFSFFVLKAVEWGWSKLSGPWEAVHKKLLFFHSADIKKKIPFLELYFKFFRYGKKIFYLRQYMTDHAGPRRYECNPGTKLWRPPVEVTQFWRPRSGFGARFGVCKTKQK